MSNLWTYREGTMATVTTSSGTTSKAIDGSIGKIDSSTADTDNAHVVVDTGWWIFGKKRLIPAGAIVAVDHQDQKVALQMTKDQIKDAPDFDETVTLTAADRGVYDDYYRPFGS